MCEADVCAVHSYASAVAAAVALTADHSDARSAGSKGPQRPGDDDLFGDDIRSCARLYRADGEHGGVHSGRCGG